jgi:LCP family protein required for cell wall assembly
MGASLSDRDENLNGPDDEHPSQPTEEYLMEAADQPGSEPGSQAAEPPGSSGEQPEQPVAPPDPDTGEPATEEIFAFEAKLRGAEEVPELDPVFRAALLETSESSAVPDPADAAPGGSAAGQGSGAAGDPPTGGHGEGLTGEEELSGEFPITEEGTSESEAFITEEQTAILAAAAKSEVHHAIEDARRTGRAFDPVRPPVTGDFEGPPKRRGYWWRFSLATLIIVFSFAGATSASVLNVLDDITGQFTDPGFQSLSEKILPPNNGGPQTIAIIGSDVRTGGGTSPDDPGRSDTTILLRLDPETDQIAMLSIPRDLKVEIPGYGTDKFNAAYSYGGTKLTLQTIRAVTGLDINHVINVDFQGFASVVDAIGCVFVDVDRDYFNSNEGVPAELQYAEIDIDAGYQKLCGPDALEYARYRHTDTDLVRSSRQQDLLGEVRNRLSFSEIIKRRDELIKAFTENTRSDISGSEESLELLKLLFDSRNARVVEVKFPATLGPSYVTATPDEIQGAVDKFLGFEETAGPVGTLSEGARDRRAKREAEKRKLRQEQEERAATRAPSKEEDGLADYADSGLQEAVTMNDEIGSRQFPIFYTKRLPPGTLYSDGSRTYHLRDPDKNAHAAYRMVMVLQLSDGLHYFGIQGLRGWQDPPILEAPYEETSIDGRDFRVYTESDRIRLISWFEGENTYWISNSLLLTLSNDQMLGMARATRQFTPGS